MKIKGVSETSPLCKEHGYLGEHKNNLEAGHTPHGKITRHSQGTSNLKDDSAGNIPKDTNQKY